MEYFKFNSVLDVLDVFSNDEVCMLYLEWRRWGGNVVSPFDRTSKVYNCGKFRYKCKNTGKYFTVKTGTLFENTKISLRKWFVALYLESNHKKGISSLQLSKDIGVTQKTAWFMLHRIRKCFGEECVECLQNEVEADETYIEGSNKNRHKHKRIPGTQGRSTKE